jgi:hypothetical protein
VRGLASDSAYPLLKATVMSPYYGPGLLIVIVFWLVWLAVGIAALVAFFRGMKALTEMARRVEHIEHLLQNREESTSRGAI